ncbi:MULTISPECIES: ABC transporter ATP-binding protein [Haloarcula]|uniref:ABC-type D-xylose/L-arabinose transporter n=1 Tax=Haloarcula pellucida TaxID=1427151 RepID=A0A830GQ14_9EURY|nr:MULTISPECIES: sn-glycerol-3-phosphate ABC transporter ATP-binding protein UgpC [Halomicroarcula]MBX0349650.1 sn-glycerol-3-phosphate ABC transporter ATP-binding protein UgpC [Halomicroarcula pellucida]MDS0279793.1 sn-glycerol-3-phosphate ABC transporter ATP-binding protein UgpC [Halomicroarcula sp. S1AR25-4]GGN95715.1 ABC transporter ATP-binding protein [Halomicroarcula pellucida]
MADTTLTDVKKRFESDGNDVVAVDELSLDIEDGEFLVLVGPSGCGKSTTLRLIAGLETISDGEIKIGDDVVNDVKPKDRDIAMVFQNYALYPQRTVRGNMSFGLKMSTDLPDEKITERVEDAAELLSITDLLDRRPKALSGGQQQRVALGRAIVRDPELFLMDEPLSNLDAKLRTQMRTELQELHQQLGAATVYVTHDQTEAMTMGDRIAVLDDGQLQQIGTPMECYYEPANQFVAGFIGSPSMNFIEGVFVDGLIHLDLFRYPLTDEQRAAIESEDSNSVTVGIRPEDIELTDEDGPRTVEMDVNVVEPMGSMNLLHLERSGVEITASVTGEHIVDESDCVRVRFPADRIHAFDRQTGAAVFNRERSADRPPGILSREEVPSHGR